MSVLYLKYQYPPPPSNELGMEADLRSIKETTTSACDAVNLNAAEKQ